MPLLGNDASSRTTSHIWTTEQLIAASAISVIASYGFTRFYKTKLRRIPNVSHLKPEWMHKRSLYGKVTRVGDGDNFHLYHTPGGKWAAWGLLRPIPKKLKDQTLAVRIAGVDAPECAHFGRPEQPYGPEALQWLRDKILGRYVRVVPYRKDQYARVVATVYRRKWLGLAQQDVGLEMLKAGYATVYEAQKYSEFGGQEEMYRAAEKKAKERGIGMWSQPGVIEKLLGAKKGKQEAETPRQFKSRMAEEEKQNSGK